MARLFKRVLYLLMRPEPTKVVPQLTNVGRVASKSLPKRNALACYAAKSVLKIKAFYNFDTWCKCYKTFFSSLQMTRPNKLECLYLAITFQSSLAFAGNTRSLPKKEASERSSNRVSFGLALKF